MSQPILEFQGEYRFLSNFARAEFVWDNIVWKHSEGAYQAAKTLDREERLEMSKVDKPGEIKRQGKQVACRAGWDQIKYDIMHEIVLAKFTQNPELKAKLLATVDAHLEEGNYWKDREWGVCPPRSGNGKNLLGKILMQVREELNENS